MDVKLVAAGRQSIRQTDRQNFWNQVAVYMPQSCHNTGGDATLFSYGRNYVTDCAQHTEELD